MNNEFRKIFGEIEDLRIDRTKLHNLLDIIALGILGVMAGAQVLRRSRTLAKPMKNGSETILS